MRIEHFGVKVYKTKKSFKLVREEFAAIDTKPSLPVFQSFLDDDAYEDAHGQKYKEEWCQRYRDLCLKNFDLNMKYFASLEKEAFDKEMDRFLSTYKGFEAVDDLKKYSGVEGYYLLLLDEYKQAYIGKSKDVKKRIMRHWSDVKAFDRTLLPIYGVNTSCFSIDFFRARDTTRIYIWKRELKDGIEAELIKNFPREYRLNRIGGDITSLLEAVNTINSRNLNQFM